MFSTLFQSIILLANQGVPRFDFLREVSNRLLKFFDCEAVVLHYKENGKYYYCKLNKHNTPAFQCQTHLNTFDEKNIFAYNQGNNTIGQLYSKFIQNKFVPQSGNYTNSRSFWSGNVKELKNLYADHKSEDEIIEVSEMEGYNSVAMIPIEVDNKKLGLLELWSEQADYFTEEKIKSCEDAAQMLGFALAHRNAQVAWRERVKELACLYEISKIITKPEITLEDILNSIVKLLPPAWLYPKAAEARIVFDDKSYTTSSFRKTSQIQSADIFVNGEARGVIEVAYTEEMPENDIGPFLKEESDLLDTVTKEVGYIIERKYADIEKLKLQEQLRHADRLALIGQLVAGVAHELNEPIGNILGFAQLAKKNSPLPKQTGKDIDKIINASLYIRDIIKQLLTFARETPYERKTLNLNRIIKGSLAFFESRCTKEGIELKISLFPKLPKISADQSQIIQVLLNLVYNAMHAMPDGGKLTISTFSSEPDVILAVEDTGIGIGEDTQKKLFLPFFTTKPTGQGTGLGLSVVHGIVAAHGGSITVNSKLGEGSRFEVRIPILKKTKKIKRSNP